MKYISSIILTYLTLALGSSLMAQCPFPSELEEKVEVRYDADINSNTGGNPTLVDALLDIGGLQFDFNSNGGDESKPEYIPNALNDKGAIFLDGNDLMEMNFPIDVMASHIIFSWDGVLPFSDFNGLLVRPTGPGSFRLFMGQNGASELWPSGFFDSNIIVNNEETLTISSDAQYNSVYAYRDLSEELNQLQLGKDFGANRYWHGKLVSLILFNEELDEVELKILRDYIICTYTPLPEHESEIIKNDFCPVVLDFGREYFKSYNWNTGSSEGFLEVAKTGNYDVEIITIFNDTLNASIDVQFPGTFIDSFNKCQFEDSLYATGLEDYDVEWQDESTETDYLITEGGEYYLTVTDNEGCSFDSDTVYVTEDFFPTEVELVEPEVFCQGNELYLEGGFDDAESYLWNTDEETAFIEPQESGEYWVEATNANGCVGRDTVQIDMAGIAPTVEMEIGVACETREVSFADATEPVEGTIVEQNWIFDPFDSAQGPEVEQVYDTAGDYPVILDVLLDNGCTGQKRDTVHVKHLPLVEFNYDAVIPCAGNEVAFESQSAVPGGGQIEGYAWEFSNETTDEGIVGSTTFEELGTESVLHIVQTTDGCIDSLEVPVVVLGSPIVEFAFDTVCIGLATSFQEMVDTEESGPVFYQWQFGDGFFSNFPNTSHEYAAPGVYEVTLTATGNDFGNAGCVDAKTQQVRVFPAPDAAISLEDGCLNIGAMLVDVTQASEVAGAIDPIAVRSWEVVVGPDLTEVIGEDSVQTFQPENGGTSTILFTYETEAGCEGGTNGSVQVLSIPQSVFSLEVPNEAPPVSAIPENLSVDATQYAWAIDGEVVSNDESPLLFFPDTGTYVVELVAQNELGCADASSQGVTVIVPKVDIALLDISFEQNGTRLELTALLSNYGNVPITTFDLEVQIGQTINFSQEVEETILPGEVVPYSLSADFQYTPGRILPYTCMTVSNPNGVGDDELDLENNSVCIGLDKERVTFIKPFPNPVGDVLHLEFVLPKGGTMEVTFISSDGKEMGNYSFELEEGYAKSEIDMSSYAEGMYVIQYDFEGEVHTERVVVSE